VTENCREGRVRAVEVGVNPKSAKDLVMIKKKNFEKAGFRREPKAIKLTGPIIEKGWKGKDKLTQARVVRTSVSNTP